MKNRGLFITFEGGDGAGKTTLIDKVHSFLLEKGFAVVKTRAPGGTKVGESIRSLLLDHGEIPLSKRAELFLFLADRAQHVEEVILPALSSGKVVLCDRYNDSTVAYQGAARGFEKSWVETLCAFVTDGTQPDLTIYLDIDPKLGLERVQRAGTTKDRIESETIAFHEKIRRAFHDIAKDDPERFHKIDATNTPDVVFRKAVELIHAIL